MAIVVGNEPAYGMLRMLQILAENVCLIRAVRSLAEAEAWLQTLADSDAARAQ